MRKVTLWSGATSADFRVSLGVACRRGAEALLHGAEATAACGAASGARDDRLDKAAQLDALSLDVEPRWLAAPGVTSCFSADLALSF